MRLSTLVFAPAIALLVGIVHAQNTATTTTTPAAAAATTTTAAAAAATTTATTNAAANTATTTTNAVLPAVTTSSTGTNTATSATTTNTQNKASSTSTEAALPQISSSTNPPLPSLNTNQPLPSLTQDNANIPTYQVVIPNNVNNPFLQTSPYPQNTVFIVVGSVLGGIAFLLIGWRAIRILWLYRQSRQRKDQKYSEMAESSRPFPHSGSHSSLFPPPASSGNTISMDFLRADRASKAGSFYNSPRPSSTRPSTSTTAAGRPTSTIPRSGSSGNLLASNNVQFFSPSAHPGGTTAAVLGTQARESVYLPPGYYLRDASANNSSTSIAQPSPKQPWAAPTTPASSQSFLLSDLPPVPNIPGSRKSVASSVAASTNGGEKIYDARPVSGNGNGQYPSHRRGPSGGTGDIYYGGTADRRASRPSQALDDLLGGRN